MAHCTYSVSGEAAVENSSDEATLGELEFEAVASCNDSDVDFEGLESEDDVDEGRNDEGHEYYDLHEDGNVEGQDSQEYEENEYEDEPQWTDELTDFQIPEFASDTGINFPLPDDPCALDFFLPFFRNELWDLIVDETNRFAVQKSSHRRKKFQPVTSCELKAFIGINIMMGIVKLPSVDLYWSSDNFFGNQGIKKVMPKNRFEEINGYLHFSDSTREPARGSSEFDRLYKIRPILSYVQAMCSENFKPSKNISVNEGMIRFMGHFPSKKKPSNHGIRVWLAADASNGYVLNFNVYTGKEAGETRVHGLGYDVVTKLVTPFMNKNHHVFFDNFFTSTRLLEHLEAQDTYCCGTVRSHRNDLPSCAKRKLGPGQKVVRQKGHVVFYKWHGNREVNLLCNILSPLVQDVDVERSGQQTQKPRVACLYNQHIGGADLANQIRKYYSIGRTSHHWYRYLFWFLVDVSICNAFVLCNFFRREKGKSKLKQLTFRTDLAKELIGGFSSCMATGVAQAQKRRKIETLALDQANAGKHFIVKIKGRKRVCVQCKKDGNTTQGGNHVESSFECLQCSVALCKVGCFNNYHTSRQSLSP